MVETIARPIETAGHRRAFIVRKPVIAAIVLLIPALAYLLYAGVHSASTYYYTVGELLSKDAAAATSDVRVTGRVAEGSVTSGGAGSPFSFSLTDGEQTLPVRYQGAPPDAFKEGGDIVAEGRIDASGTFQASTLITKCPSKYEARAAESSD